MVFIRHIEAEHEKLKQDEEIVLFYRSGRQNTIRYGDKLKKINGEIVFTRYHKGKKICKVYIDCAEVESMIIHKKEWL